MAKILHFHAKQPSGVLQDLRKERCPPVDLLVGPLGWPVPAHLKAGETKPKERKWKANKAGILSHLTDRSVFSVRYKYNASLSVDTIT